MNLLRTARRELRLSQEAIEDITGISRWKIYTAERGKRVLRQEEVEVLSDILDLRACELEDLVKQGEGA